MHNLARIVHFFRTLLGVFAVLAASSTAIAKPRVIVMSDIGGTEPDDKQSFIRLLLYSNELDIVGLIGANSQFGATRGDSTQFINIINQWNAVRPNLLLHADGWPTADELKAVVCEGQRQVVGMAGVGEDWDTAGSQWIIERLQDDDERPLWVLAWGGINTLSQALWRIQQSDRSQAEKDALVAKLRVYDIAGQDDSGAWIAHTFPDIFYIRSGKQFMSFSYRRDWQGQPQQDGDLTVVNWNWFIANVRAHPPYGTNYPSAAYMFEGDTPSFLYLLDNGLGSPEHPDYGSWGGRFSAEKVSPPTRYSGKDNSAYMPAYMYNDTETDAIDFQGTGYNTIFTPLWRWRYDYQNDFAARMNWTVATTFTAANHEPVAVVQGDATTLPVRQQVLAGQTVTLSATGSTDPDADTLTYEWWNYAEVGTLATEIDPADAGAAVTTITVPADALPGDAIHMVLTLRDDGTPVLTSYRRVILDVVADLEPPVLTTGWADGAVTLEWEGDAVFETADDPSGPWLAPDPQPVSPYTVPASTPSPTFYRLSR